jgi:hypothetical protein
VPDVPFVLAAHAIQMADERTVTHPRQDRRAVAITLATRTTSCARAKSTSFTRRRRHSRSLTPAPYKSVAMRRRSPSRAARTTATSSRDSTTGSRAGRFARTMSCSHGISRSRTTR